MNTLCKLIIEESKWVPVFKSDIDYFEEKCT